MSSRAAAAMYPALARAEAQRRQAQFQPKSKPEAQPAWGKSTNPVWSGEVRSAPNGLDRVPGLRRKSTNRR
jgi:hypothetical protein